MVQRFLGNLFGGTRFSNAETTFLRAGIRRGSTREQLRQQFRTVFARGLPNTAFTEIRASIEAGDLAGSRILRGSARARIPASSVPTVRVLGPRNRFVVSARVRTRIRSTNTVLERFVRFGAAEVPSRQEITARVSEIIDRGVSAAESEMELEDFDGITIIQQEQA